MNTKEDLADKIEALQNKLGNLKVWLAVPMGVMMILYFFSYATLIDHGMTGLFYFELVSSVLFVLILVYLNSVAYKILKWRYRKHQRFQFILELTDAKSINKPVATLSEQLLVASTNSPKKA